MTGRARGRSRGRGRGRGRGGPGAEGPDPPRPGRTPPTAQQEEPQGAAAAPLMTGSGRARQRVGTAEGPPPGSGGGSPPGACGGLPPPGPGGHPPQRRRDADLLPGGPAVPAPQAPGPAPDKRGTSGTPIIVASNYFRMTSAPDWQLYQYKVTFTPDVESKGLRMRLVKEQRELLGPTRAFDGGILFLPKCLPDLKTEVYGTRKSDGAKIQITFERTNEVPQGDPVCIQLYNIIFRRLLAMIDMKQIGRHFYNPKQSSTIPQHRLEVWPGFNTSILQHETSVMLCAEITHKVLRTETVYDMMDDLYRRARGKNTFFDEATKKVVGEIVLTPYNNKTYRIDEINWEANPGYTFKLGDGSEISLTNYYKKQYNIEIQDPQQPLLVSMPSKKDAKRGRTDPVLLIPELCRVTGMSEEANKDFFMKKDLAAHTRLNPVERVAKLAELNQTLARNEDVRAELEGWKMAFDDKLVEVTARTLNAEQIQQRSRQNGEIQKYEVRQRSRDLLDRNADWSNQVSRDWALITGGVLPQKRWLLLTTPGEDEAKARNFVVTLRRVGEPMGMRIEEPQLIVLPNDRTHSYDNALKSSIASGIVMVVCIVPNTRKDRYDVIKKRCCLLNPVPSQVIVSKSLNPKILMSVTTKIAIQLNCKLGGEAWRVEIPPKTLMVVGIDVYHDAKGGKSVSAFVASTNTELTQYYSRCNIQASGQEIVDGLKLNMRNALGVYGQLNGTLPQHIVVYRDGVGEGQYAVVKEHEVAQLKECFREVDPPGKYTPKLSVVIVTKRINTRFFAKGQRSWVNPPSGTVVDSEVTRPDNEQDFFLVSQSVRQGTVTPTHYIVVHGADGFRADLMQRLTYKLTHLYYNWPGTVRVPAPCQYAHKMAFLVGQSLNQEVTDNALCRTLFYL